MSLHICPELSSTKPPNAMQINPIIKGINLKSHPIYMFTLNSSGIPANNEMCINDNFSLLI